MLQLGKKLKESLSRVERSARKSNGVDLDQIEKVLEALDKTIISPANVTSKEWIWILSLTQEDPLCSKVLTHLRKKLKELTGLHKTEVTWFILWKVLSIIEFTALHGGAPCLSYLESQDNLRSDATLFHLETHFQAVSLPPHHHHHLHHSSSHPQQSHQKERWFDDDDSLVRSAATSFTQRDSHSHPTAVSSTPSRLKTMQHHHLHQNGGSADRSLPNLQSAAGGGRVDSQPSVSSGGGGGGQGGGGGGGVDVGQLVRAKARSIIENVCDASRLRLARQEKAGLIQLPGMLILRSEMNLNPDNLSLHLANPAGLPPDSLKMLVPHETKHERSANPSALSAFNQAIESFRRRSTEDEVWDDGFNPTAGVNSLRILSCPDSPHGLTAINKQDGLVRQDTTDLLSDLFSPGNREEGSLLELVESACTSNQGGGEDAAEVNPVDTARILHQLSAHHGNKAERVRAVLGVILAHVAVGASCDDASASPMLRWPQLSRSLSLLETLLDKGVLPPSHLRSSVMPTLEQLRTFGLSLPHPEDRRVTGKVRTRAIVLLNMMQASATSVVSEAPPGSGSGTPSTLEKAGATPARSLAQSKSVDDLTEDIDRMEIQQIESYSKPPISSNPLFDQDE